MIIGSGPLIYSPELEEVRGEEGETMFIMQKGFVSGDALNANHVEVSFIPSAWLGDDKR